MAVHVIKAKITFVKKHMLISWFSAILDVQVLGKVLVEMFSGLV